MPNRVPKRKAEDRLPDFTKATWLHLDKMTGRALNDYMNQVGLVRSTDVIREITAVALSQNPADAVTSFMRKKAYDDTRIWIINQFYAWMNEKQAELQQMVDASRVSTGPVPFPPLASVEENENENGE